MTMSEHMSAPSAPPTDPDEDLRELVRNNSGQGSFEEYKYLRDTIRSRAPCHVLVFGVGKDSHLWIDANKGGSTVFVEHSPEWIQKTRERLPDLVVHQVTYRTRRTKWKRLLERQDKLFMEDLPNDVLAANWGVIFVDAPPGHSDKDAGRMKSIYTAAVLARRSTDVHVLVHDCDREVEQVYTDRFLGPERMVKQVRSLRHYRLRPSLP
jgi:glucuronoxylan 4-O-methyltransferase